MTDYHAEGVKLLAYVPARSLPSALTRDRGASDDDREPDLLAPLDDSTKLGTPPTNRRVGLSFDSRSVRTDGARAPETTRSTDSLD